MFVLPPGQALEVSSLAFFRGFMPQKTTFITITINATTAMDT